MDLKLNSSLINHNMLPSQHHLHVLRVNSVSAMRLLRCADLEIEESFGDEIPEYAILSHTWERNQEITFAEANALIDDGGFRNKGTQASSRIRAKSGLQKILRFIDQAVSLECNYAWVDTCCIDKSSSAELSEAINSMFRWYRNASVCLVYLVDLDVSREPSTQEQFKRCRWHSRGFCLQELVAPVQALFFDKEWRYYGHKVVVGLLMRLPGQPDSVDLSVSLSEITQIPVQILQWRYYAQASIAQRMSWAANRTTTRVEDMAYCLLGLFDINMPLLYGEGSKAFIRLQEEIIQRTNDQSIFAWSHDRIKDVELRYGGMFAPSPACFAGSGNIVPAY